MNWPVSTVFTVSLNSFDPVKISGMPIHIEARIQALCAEAIAAKDEADVERIIAEFRAALTEHIQKVKKFPDMQTAFYADQRDRET